MHRVCHNCYFKSGRKGVNTCGYLSVTDEIRGCIPTDSHCDRKLTESQLTDEQRKKWNRRNNTDFLCAAPVEKARLNPIPREFVRAYKKECMT